MVNAEAFNEDSFEAVLSEANDRDQALARLRAMPHDVTTAEDIGYAFRLILGRLPNPEEWPGHSSFAGSNLTETLRTYFNSLEFANRRLMDPPALSNVVCTDYPGFKIYSSLDDVGVGVHVAAGNYESHVQAAFKHYIKPGDTVLDVGANIGFFSMFAADLTGSSGQVISIEPNSRNIRLLEASRRASGFDHMEIHCLAANHEPALLVLNTAFTNGTVSQLSDDLTTLMNSEIVPASTIDTLVGDRKIDFLKIDVEGAELKALKGGEKTLRASRPVIVSEFSHTGIHEGGQAYLDWLAGLGYEFAVIGYDGQIGAFDVATAPIVDAFVQAGVDHIDIAARPVG